MPVLLGGPTHLTVGLIAAFVAVACIIAADTGAYFCGKAFGRTQVRVLPTGWRGTKWRQPLLRAAVMGAVAFV
jgi:hypothetical protein